MKTGIILLILLVVCVMFVSTLNPVYCETIYTIKGEVIQARVSEKTETVIWYEVPVGDMVKYIGINISEIDKIPDTKYEELRIELHARNGKITELEEKIAALEAREEARAPYDDKMTELMKRLVDNPEIKELIKKESRELKVEKR